MEKTILFHACCAPCLINPLKILENEGWQVLVYWYNPNIHPATEYMARRDCLRAYLKEKGNELIEESGELDNFIVHISRGESQAQFPKRCHFCYEKRLEKTRAMAEKLGIPYFSTTLLISPYQDHQALENAGFSAGQQGPDGSGPPAPQGLLGQQGLDGSSGPPAAQGLLGQQGLDESSGPQVAQGLLGQQGPDGSGPPAAQGLLGQQGLDGSSGPPAAQLSSGLGNISGPQVAGKTQFYYRDFRPDFRKGQTMAREKGFYMQKYCGCIFSEIERYGKKLKK